METQIRILVISGSLRQDSSNQKIIDQLASIVPHNIDFNIYSDLGKLPHFDGEEIYGIVDYWRKRIQEADGVLICTPEYAMGIPGSLKNAIDWTVSSCEFSHKPVALITASTSGSKGHKALIDVLNVIEAIPAKEEQLLIPFAKTKIDESNKIKDPATFEQLRDLAHQLYMKMNEANSAS